MTTIYRFPSNIELTEEKKAEWDMELQTILADADKRAAMAAAYVCEPPSSNPFEQMARERCYYELKNISAKMSERHKNIISNLKLDV